MNKTKEKMQLAAAIIFLLLFGAVIVFSLNSKVANLPDEKLPTEFTSVVEIETASTIIQQTAAETFPCITVETAKQEQTENLYVYYDIPLDDDFQEYIQNTCNEYGFDRYDVIIALIEKESLFNEKIISSTDDYGYMQINKCNHEWLSEELNINDFLDGKQNVLAGIYILSKLYEKYDDIELALMAYGCGEGGAKELWKQGTYSTEHSQAVMKKASDLQIRHQ